MEAFHSSDSQSCLALERLRVTGCILNDSRPSTCPFQKPCRSSPSFATSFASEAVNFAPFSKSDHSFERSSFQLSGVRSQQQYFASSPSRPRSGKVKRPRARNLTSVSTPSKVTLESAESGISSVSKAAYTSFYSASNSSLESLNTSAATSVESLPRVSPRVVAFEAQTMETHTTGTKGRPRNCFSRPRRVSLMGPIATAVNSSTPMSRDLSFTPKPTYPIATTNTSSSRRKSFMSKHASLPIPVDNSRGPSHYYQDPEARTKLKQYLASPQKFEEALEYGFASTPVASPMSPRVLPEFSDNHVQRFLEDSDFLDTSSQFGGLSQESEESDSDDDEEAPHVRSGHVDSMDQTYDFRQSARSTTSLRCSQTRHRKFFDGDMFGDREMTLRLTLTKPQLREDGSDTRVQTIIVKKDPLALEELPSVRQHATIRGSRDVGSSGKVQGLLRRLKPQR